MYVLIQDKIIHKNLVLPMIFRQHWWVEAHAALSDVILHDDDDYDDGYDDYDDYDDGYNDNDDDDDDDGDDDYDINEMQN